MNSLSTQKMAVTLQAMDEKNQNSLRLLLASGVAKNHYTVVDQIDSADVCIFDLDTLHSMDKWRTFRADYPDLPTIILSLQQTEIAGTQFVKKPLQINTLLKVLEKIKTERYSVKTQNLASNARQQATDTKHAKVQAEISITETEEAIHEYCGHNQDIDPQSRDFASKCFYNPKQYLQSVFYETYQKAQKVDNLLIGLSEDIILRAHHNEILCAGCFNDERRLHTMCVMPYSRHHVDMQNISDEEIAIYAKSHAVKALDAFLWRVALWTARGRLPIGTNVEQKITLHHWPNFTRLVVTPHALEITALWLAQPQSLLQTIQCLGIPQRYVFALYTACHAIGLVIPVNQSVTALDNDTGTNTATRGLFQRLISRLRHVAA